MSLGGRVRELVKRYGKVALGVHLSVSAASITGLYVAIRQNVDVESLFRRFGISSGAPPDEEVREGEVNGDRRRKSAAEIAASGGGALAMAVLMNKALFPVRVPITVALTPPIARFLARRKLIKGQGTHL